MSHVGLDRPDDTLPRAPLRVRPQRLEARQLDSVSHRGSGRVALDMADIFRTPTGLLVGMPHGPQLSFAARREQAAIHVVGETRAGDDRVDAIAVGECVVQALEYDESSISIYGEEPKAWFNKGLTLEEMGNSLAAEKAFLQTVYLDSKHYQAWNALAVLEIKRENYQIAKKNLLKSLATNKKENANAWNNLAIVFEKLGESEKSKSCLNEVKEQED